MPNHNGYRNRGGDFICVPQKWVSYVTEVDPDINVKIKSYKFPFLLFSKLQMCNQQKSNLIVLWRVFVMKIQDNLFNPDVHCFFFFRHLRYCALWAKLLLKWTESIIHIRPFKPIDFIHDMFSFHHFFVLPNLFSKEYHLCYLVFYVTKQIPWQSRGILKIFPG